MRRSHRAAANAARCASDDIDDLLEATSQEKDGTYRVVASRALPGKPIGRLRFVGTRPDDPNDIIPHEDRRELRGYGVFAAWLNHVDAKSINSLDTLVSENGRAHVRHNLIDFGSALGSGGVAPADYWAGEESLVEPRGIGSSSPDSASRSPSGIPRPITSRQPLDAFRRAMLISIQTRGSRACATRLL